MIHGPTTLSLSKRLLDSTMAPYGEVGRWYGILQEAKQQGSSFLDIKSPAYLSSLPHLNHIKETSRIK